MFTQIKLIIKDTASSIRQQPTLSADCVPRVLHEPAILSGYRVPYRSWRYYFYSAFQLHNETLNVWTHLLGVCVILYQMRSYFQELDINTDSVLSTLLSFSITGIFSLAISALCHLFHGRSPYVHFIAFMIDYIGASRVWVWGRRCLHLWILRCFLLQAMGIYLYSIFGDVMFFKLFNFLCC